jgi:inhibitor of cysteine peptidase
MSGKSMDTMPLVLLGLVVVGILAAFAASVMLPSSGVTASYGIGDNGKTISMSEGATIKIILDENPTTGYSWNESLTSGLKITGSNYIQGGSPGLAGAGGTHEWTIKATGKGEQQFSAAYKRPWEPLSGSENTFRLTINVA